MSKKQIFRIFVCTICICCLLSTTFLQPAAASLAAPVIGAVPGLNVIAVILLGLGILYTAASTDWDAVFNAAEDLFTENGFIDEDGNCKIIKMPDPNGGVPKWFVDVTLIEMIRQWLFDNGIIDYTVSNSLDFNGVLLPDLTDLIAPYNEETPYQVLFFRDTANTYYYAMSELPLEYTASTDTVKAVKYYRVNSTYITEDGNWHTPVDDRATSLIISQASTSIIWLNHDIEGFTAVSGSNFPTISSGQVTTDLDLLLGEVAPLTETLEEGYPEWDLGFISVPGSSIGVDADYVTAAPVSIGATLEDTLAQTQQQIWAGESTYEEPETGTGTDVWNPPSDPGEFALDLTNIFPFCIPFDLYAFLTCLNADPVAPVIQWEIYLPGGGSFPLELDLSPFDSVAQLLRRLQLLLFIIALAMKTRDLIRG